MNSKKILFLCQEPADYLFNCITTFSKLNPRLTVFVVYKKLPPATPFLLDSYAADNLIMLKYENLKVKDLISFIKQTVGLGTIYVTGWRDKKYLPACIFAKSKKINVIWCFDNPWLSEFKQLIGLPLIKILRYLSASHAFITGNAQYTYARKLGFDHTNLSTGLYVANEQRFCKKARSNFEKRFVYVGRLIEYKWVIQLADVFLELKTEFPNDWMMVIIGNGPLADQIKKDPSIKHIEFLQPKELVDELSTGGIACIPSLVENWGVVVHEFALMGYPLLSSDRVHAASQFLINNYNGYLFNAGNRLSLKNTLLKFMHSTDDKLLEMGKKSKLLAGENNLEIWCEKVKNMMR